MARLLGLALLPFAAGLTTGCPIFQPIGACTYGQSEPETGTVEIVSISAPVIDQGPPFVTIEVRGGLFSRSVAVSVDVFETCFQARGWQVGSSVPARIISGGPCPPEYQVGDCTPNT
jgi:hypothetical protein